MGEEILAKPRNDALGRGREEVHLREVHHALYGEQPHQQDGDAIEQAAIVLLERGVQQVANHCGNASPTPAATTRHAAAATSRPAYGRTSGSSRRAAWRHEPARRRAPRGSRSRYALTRRSIAIAANSAAR